MLVEEVKLYALMNRWDSTFKKEQLLLCMPISQRNVMNEKVMKSSMTFYNRRRNTSPIELLQLRFLRKIARGGDRSAISSRIIQKKGQNLKMFYDQFKNDIKSTKSYLSDSTVE
ncbi:hypothetical protein RF11_01354 [Thelohanellus kitauei]|uniref:Uncharacterized protein n=1 Tax=Thelohanellus kitauei TaxID=669202 RepID=A0A0C2N663_THEKT|nr:hypothetical protein RF11_01354 [Thelohanellus kitauei]